MLQLRFSSRIDYEMIALSDFYEKEERGHRHLKSTPGAQSIHTGYGIMTKEDFSVCPRCQISITVLTYTQTHLRAKVSSLNINSHSYAKSVSQRWMVILKWKFVEKFLH